MKEEEGLTYCGVVIDTKTLDVTKKDPFEKLESKCSTCLTTSMPCLTVRQDSKIR